MTEVFRGQVTTVRQELEDFLKDDDDMAKMCLSRKRDQAAQWAAANVQGTSPSAHFPQCALPSPLCHWYPVPAPNLQASHAIPSRHLHAACHAEALRPPYTALLIIVQS